MLRINFQESAEKNVINVLECSFAETCSDCSEGSSSFFLLIWHLELVLCDCVADCPCVCAKQGEHA